MGVVSQMISSKTQLNQHWFRYLQIVWAFYYRPQLNGCLKPISLKVNQKNKFKTLNVQCRNAVILKNKLLDKQT